MHEQRAVGDGAAHVDCWLLVIVPWLGGQVGQLELLVALEKTDQVLVPAELCT